MEKIIEIPEGYEARIEGNKVVLEPKESEDERIPKLLHKLLCAEVSAEQFEKHGLTVDDALYWLEKQKGQKPIMIQWTGKNLKEVIDFTGKSKKFSEWFKSWEDFENYLHTHDDIIKLFCEDGSHYEVPVGAWIVKTPDGYNIPSRFRFIQKPAEWSYPYGRNETVDRLVSLAECLEMDGDCLFNGYSGTECGKFLRDLARKQIGCKPAEWSEEDDNIYNAALDAIYYKDLCDKDEVVDALKELCDLIYRKRKVIPPYARWKPSEDQIQSLYNILQDPKKAGSISDRASIVGLIHDLKKPL